MNFSDDDKMKIETWLKERCSALRCFCCGSNHWALNQNAAMTVMYDVHSGRIYYMDGYPMVGLACQYCAHITWFSAPLMGIKPGEFKNEVSSVK